MIRQTQLYNIIVRDDVENLELFLKENPKFDILTDTVTGRRYNLIEQAIISSSVKCTQFLIDLIYFDVMVENYMDTIIHYYSEPIFDLFVNQFNECVKYTGKKSCINFFILQIMTTSKIPEQIIKKFTKYYYITLIEDRDIDFFKELLFNLITCGKTSIKILSYWLNGSNTILTDLLNNDLQFKRNLENIIINNKYMYAQCFLEYYEKYFIDSDEFYGRIILKDNNYLKKLISFFSHTNLNINININGFCYKYKYDEKYFNYQGIWISSYQYSLAFLYVIKGHFNKKKYTKLNLFKTKENFEMELNNLINEKHYASFIYWGGNRPYNACIFYGILWSVNRTGMGIKFYCEEAKYCLIYFFGHYNREYNIIKKFFDLAPYFTDNFYSRLLEINEQGLAITNAFYEYEQFDGPDCGDFEVLDKYQSILQQTQRVYESNKEMIELFRTGTLNLDNYLVNEDDHFDY
jgi:hypothetical protein